MELLGQNKVDHHQRKVAIISQDSFYKVLTPDQKAKALKGQYNFDHPGRSKLVVPQCLYAGSSIPSGQVNFVPSNGPAIIGNESHHMQVGGSCRIRL